jgi:hypothetical protein
MHRGAGTWELPPPGGNPDAALLGLRVPSFITTQQLLDRVYITEARRSEEGEEGIGGPDRVTGAAVQINPLLDAASCAVAYAKGLLWHGASRRASYRSYAS